MRTDTAAPGGRPRRLPDVLAARARDQPDRLAHDDTANRLTYAEWHAEADAVAGGLAAAGVRPGDRVWLPVTNQHAVGFCISYVAAQRAGAIAVPVSTRLAGPELAAYHALVTPDWCITDVPEVCRELPFRGWWTVDELPHDPAALPDPGALPPGADADILSTSGTTGRPKGVVFTHAELLDLVGDGSDWARAGTMLHALPLTGYGGCHGLMLSTLRYGHTLVTMPAFDPRRCLELIADRRPDTVHLVPAMLRLVLDLDDVAAYDVSSVRWLITGTAPLPHDTVRRVDELWPRVRVINAYGMTESAVGLTTRSRESARKPGSVGRPDDPGAVEVRDAAGNALPPGDVGEVWTRAERGRRYWNDPEATAAAWRGGWLQTGDLGYVDADGDLILTGRAKELIIRGGYNISPAEVEDVLLSHPAVREAAVVGVPHEVLGEDVAAAVTIRAGHPADPDDLRAWCAARLADNKVPRTLVVCDALPYNPNGKVLKREVAAWLSEGRVS